MDQQAVCRKIARGSERVTVHALPQGGTTRHASGIVGKTVQVDEGNRYFFNGKIEKETIEGWGFPRYIVSKLGPMAGTLMAVNPKRAKGEPFCHAWWRTLFHPL